MEVVCTRDGGVAALALEMILMPVVEALMIEAVLDAVKFPFGLLDLGRSLPTATNPSDKRHEIIEGFPLSSLGDTNSESIPEGKDAGESDEDEEEDEDNEGGDQDDDGGEEDYSGDEGNDEDDNEDEVEANGEGGSDDDEEDDDDDDEDDDEDEDEDDEEDEDDDQPPPKKRK